ncbi:hypothetical protein ACUNF9_27490, partial [Serratia sp. IR-2025]
CGKKIGPDPRNFNQRVSLGRNDLLIRTFPNNAPSTDLNSKELILLSGIFTTDCPGEIAIFSAFIFHLKLVYDGRL